MINVYNQLVAVVVWQFVSHVKIHYADERKKGKAAGDGSMAFALSGMMGFLASLRNDSRGREHGLCPGFYLFMLSHLDLPPLSSRPKGEIS